MLMTRLSMPAQMGLALSERADRQVSVNSTISELEAQNEFIGALRTADFQALKPHLRPVNLEKGEVLYPADTTIPYVYFPTEGLVSLRVRTEAGAVIETGWIGPEGLVGSMMAAGMAKSVDEAVVAFPGIAWRMSSSAFVAACERNPSLQNAAHRYTTRLLVQAQQIAACAASHLLERRLATWMLRMRDHYGQGSLPISQEYRSHVLGVQRTSITLADKNLQAAGVIRVRRGSVDIVNPAALERAACECYGALKRKFSAVALHAPIVLPTEDASLQDGAAQALAERMTGIPPQRGAN
jgi:CRP-like cAMP-binding protein